MPLLPFGAAINEPLLGRAQHARLEPAGPNTALLFAPDQTAALERLKVLEHRGQTHPERLRELADRGGSTSKPGKHPATGGIREGLEGAIKLGRTVKHTLKYRVGSGESRHLSNCFSVMQTLRGTGTNWPLGVWKGQNSMAYYFLTKAPGGFSDTLQRVREALQTEGFGVITEIDLQKTFKEKIGVDFRPYVILGACNPTLAHQALSLEDKVGTMLPCNVVVQQKDDGIEVAAIDPVASMQAIENDDLATKATEVAARLRRAIEQLGASEQGRN